jgi:hypothetical protein
MFNPGDETNDSNKEWERRGQLLHMAVQVFHNDDEAGDATPNILDSPPRAVHSCITVAGQHNQAPQTIGQTIVHSIMQIFGDDISMHPPHNPERSSSATLSIVNVDQPLVIRNPEMLLAPFAEPDFLRPPRPAMPYKPYPGPPLPDFNYRPQMPTPEVVKEPGVILGDDWLCNIKGLSPQHSYTIPGLGGRMVKAPFYRYNFLPDYLKLLLSQGCNWPSHSHPLRARKDLYPCRVFTSKEAYTFFPGETFTLMVDFAI